jgi:hypothetical protein
MIVIMQYRELSVKIIVPGAMYVPRTVTAASEYSVI